MAPASGGATPLGPVQAGQALLGVLQAVVGLAVDAGLRQHLLERAVETAATQAVAWSMGVGVGPTGT